MVSYKCKKGAKIYQKFFLNSLLEHKYFISEKKKKSLPFVTIDESVNVFTRDESMTTPAVVVREVTLKSPNEKNQRE